MRRTPHGSKNAVDKAGVTVADRAIANGFGEGVTKPLDGGMVSTHAADTAQGSSPDVPLARKPLMAARVSRTP